MKFRQLILVCTTVVLGVVTSGTVRAQNQVVQQVQLVQPTNGNSFSVVAGANTVQQNIIWPAVLPTVGQFLKVAAVSGSNVTLEWGAGGGGSGGSTTPLVASRTAALVLTTTYQDALTVTAVANTIYRFNGRIRFTANNPATQDAEIDWTLPAGTTIDWVWVNESTGVSATGTDPETFPLTAAGQTVYISGRINVGGTGGNVVLTARRAGGTTALTMDVGSYVNYVP
jgi:hypothetical protein